ncbi:precorrin-3B C(17)-methyltransferase [Amorphus coralli]|uniref:precorrin-3B C(17)-methyltransferase n=1 Tax=Amorphus coralli TaxID=340680 RepID=UPI00037DE038|nr:precorrin-3B C(17)-methyltransferase [Amorphus coralli]
MAMTPALFVLTERGLETAERVRGVLGKCSVVAGPSAAGQEAAAGRFGDEMRTAFQAGRPVIGICATGIVVRLLAPVIGGKQDDPPVVAVAEDGSAVVPVLGGHHGANDLARRIAAELGGVAAVTTAGDLRFGVALDDPPAGWSLANPEDAKAAMAALLDGASAVVDPALDWLSDARLPRWAFGDVRLVSSIVKDLPEPDEGRMTTLVYRPRSLALGVGTDRGCPPDDLIRLAEDVLDEAGVAREAVACIVSLDRKADEPAVHALATHFGVPARFFTQEELGAVSGRLANPSEVVLSEVGVPGVAEGAALAAAGPDGRLLVEKTKTQRATCAVAVAPGPIAIEATGRPRGRLSVVGIGPGQEAWRSGEATMLLEEATDWVGYGLYLDLVGDLAHGQADHRFDLGAEIGRVQHALALAAEGRDVALISSGDAGIYAMATLVFECLAEPSASDAERRVEVVVAPGISAVQAAAARFGAPIGHDFCCVSLSDLLTPWAAIERRVRAAAEGDFVIAFYNPRSQRRRDQLPSALAILAEHRPADTPVMVAADLGRPRERLSVTTLSEFDPETVDMLSLVVVGSTATRTLTRGDGSVRVYTPRGYEAKRGAA